MKERILEFLNSQNKTSSQFAEEIGVKPSSISHIISGRNKPSLDFVIKMLTRYPFISYEWLLFGRGNMFNQPAEPSLFNSSDYDDKSDSSGKEVTMVQTGNRVSPDNDSSPAVEQNDESSFRSATSSKSGLKRIIWFYEDGSFSEFFPRSSL